MKWYGPPRDTFSRRIDGIEGTAPEFLYWTHRAVASRYRRANGALREKRRRRARSAAKKRRASPPVRCSGNKNARIRFPAVPLISQILRRRTVRRWTWAAALQASESSARGDPYAKCNRVDSSTIAEIQLLKSTQMLSVCTFLTLLYFLCSITFPFVNITLTAFSPIHQLPNPFEESLAFHLHGWMYIINIVIISITLSRQRVQARDTSRACSRGRWFRPIWNIDYKRGLVIR